MQLSISTVCTPELTWRECFAEYAKAGYRNIELLLIRGWKHFEPGQVAADEVLAECQRLGVRIVAVHAGGLDGLSDKSIAESLDYLFRVFDYAKQIDVPLVNVNGGYTPDDLPAGERPAVLRRIGLALERLDPILAKRNLRLTLENHYHFQLETPADYQAVLLFVPKSQRIGVTVDTGHFTASQVDMPALIRMLGPRVFHAHIKDHVGTESVALGKGKTDNLSVARELQAAGFGGYLSVEMEVHDRANAVRYVHESFSYMTRLMQQAQEGRP